MEHPPRPIPPRNGTQYSGVTDVVVVGPTVFAGAHGEGGGVFDGRLAVDTATGKLLWKDTCLGATTTIAVQNGVVYSGSHAHDCSSMGGWGQTNPATYQRLLAETADSGGASKNQLLHWFPQINYGPTSSYYKQGPWSMANDDKYLWVGGEFTQVGGGRAAGPDAFRDDRGEAGHQRAGGAVRGPHGGHRWQQDAEGDLEDHVGPRQRETHVRGDPRQRVDAGLHHHRVDEFLDAAIAVVHRHRPRQRQFALLPDQGLRSVRERPLLTELHSSGRQLN